MISWVLMANYSTLSIQKHWERWVFGRSANRRPPPLPNTLVILSEAQRVEGPASPPPHHKPSGSPRTHPTQKCGTTSLTEGFNSDALLLTQLVVLSISSPIRSFTPKASRDSDGAIRNQQTFQTASVS
jgi:hypothetical protein